jgi:cytochrome c nitrite reductase small subunit
LRCVPGEAPASDVVAPAAGNWRRISVVVLLVLLGVVIGVGSFTFGYGRGFSYFSTDPRACANCHIMNDEYDSWVKGPHHGAARCIDCHLPHEFVPKYIAKADNGYRHSKAFTLMNFHQPIQITPGNARILQDNCIRCHGEFVHNLLINARSPEEESGKCVHCHRGAGHGARG